jgi:hypothetical protein
VSHVNFPPESLTRRDIGSAIETLGHLVFLRKMDEIASMGFNDVKHAKKAEITVLMVNFSEIAVLRWV